MNQKGAKTAAIAAKVTKAAEKCLKQYAPNAAARPSCHFSPEMTGRFIAAIALRNTKAIKRAALDLVGITPNNFDVTMKKLRKYRGFFVLFPLIWYDQVNIQY